MLLVIGDLIDDVVVIGAHRIERGTDNSVEITHARGGSAANVAAAASDLVPTRFIGRVGADATGEALTRALASYGVDVQVQRAGRTGSIVILVDESAERTMLTDRGAAAELGPIADAWLRDATWAHIPLYGMTDAPSRAAITIALSTINAVPRSIDLSSVATMRHLGPELLGRILSELRPAVVFANIDEFELATEMDLRMPDSTLIVKDGAEPVRIITADGETSVPVPPVEEVVDTTGAGDAFAAGYLAAILSSSTPQHAAEAGIARATLALGKPGAL